MFARCLSAMKELRVESSKVLPGPECQKLAGTAEEKKEFIECIRKVSRKSVKTEKLKCLSFLGSGPRLRERILLRICTSRYSYFPNFLHFYKSRLNLAGSVRK